jgi:hypothetical protein
MTFNRQTTTGHTPLSGPESGFLRSCSLEKAPTTRKKDSRVEPQNRSGPEKALSIPFLKRGIDLVLSVRDQMQEGDTLACKLSGESARGLWTQID